MIIIVRVECRCTCILPRNPNIKEPPISPSSLPPSRIRPAYYWINDIQHACVVTFVCWVACKCHAPLILHVHADFQYLHVRWYTFSKNINYSKSEGLKLGFKSGPAGSLDFFFHCQVISYMQASWAHVLLMQKILLLLSLSLQSL